MKLSRKFVSDYIELDSNLTIKEIAEAMTYVGNEYADASKLVNATSLVIGEVINCDVHPDSDHLHVCKVDVKTEILDIVCGAPNVKKGLKVIVALNGAKLPGGEIKQSTIRGQISNGMLCSLAELGIDHKFLTENDFAGIHELPNDAKVGEDPIKYLQLDDEIIDFELTSNRGDLLSVLGMAYELGAIYKKKTKKIDIEYNEIDKSINNELSLKINTDDCVLFLAKKVNNVIIKESPLFIKNRLIASGIRPINNVVDISNYVMLETGQPLHFYDADKLQNIIEVRNALNEEKLITLDNIERILDQNDIVISNGNNVVGLAGVMGGLSTEVDSNTKNIIIEAAIFDAIKIRRTSKKILRSEASTRFEKGLDPNRTYMAINRSCHMLEKYANGQVLKDMLVYDKTNKEDKIINITIDKIIKVLGIDVNKQEVIDVYNSLGFEVIDNNDVLSVKVPSRRLDVNIKEDLIEEFGRIYGINKIKGKLPVFDGKLGTYNKVNRDIKNRLIDLGLNETSSYALIPEEEVYKYTKDNFTRIRLSDPMSEDRSTLRYSLIYSLKEIYEYNKARNYKDVSIFEMGKGFYKENDLYKEDLKLACLMSGKYINKLNEIKTDFYVIKGILINLLNYLGYENRYSFVIDENIPNELHPGQSALIIMQGENIGFIGKIHPNITKDDIFVFEINLTKLLKNRASKMSFKELNKYPEVVKDVAFVVDKNLLSSEIEKCLKKVGGRLLTNISVFDVYVGDKLNENEKSIAFSLTFQDSTKTLNDIEVTEIFNKMIEEVENKLSAKLRNK
ncbi:MAG: phenylalanine--tRNA ligase subunit beta [Bacilli bacterium]|nr:phenylalanine--tRNA ligase subunit beta [Bacilli bacterium]